MSLLKMRIPMDEAGYRVLFGQMDSDKSGSVSFTELATSLSVVGKGTTDEKLAFTFDLYDADKSGFLDRRASGVVPAYVSGCVLTPRRRRQRRC